jgi:hypothetical protein
LTKSWMGSWQLKFCGCHQKDSMMSVDSDDMGHIFKSFSQKASKPTRFLITPYRCNRFRETNTCNGWYKNPKPSSQSSSCSVAVALLIPFHSLCEINYSSNPKPNTEYTACQYDLFSQDEKYYDSMMSYYCFYNVLYQIVSLDNRVQGWCPSFKKAAEGDSQWWWDCRMQEWYEEMNLVVLTIVYFVE